MSPKNRRQNRNVCYLVLILSQNQVLFFTEVQLYISPSFNKCYGLYCDKTKLFLFQGHMVRACRQALNHASIAPVTKHRQLAHLKTTFNEEKFFLIAIKLRLKRSLSWGYNLRKRIVLVFYRRRSTQNYCVLRDQTIFLYNPLLCLPKAFRRSCLSL